MTETPQAKQAYPRVQAALAALAGWIRRAEDRRAAGRELDELPSEELDAIAHDLGVSVHDLHAVSAKGRNGAALLFERMAALKLDRATVQRTLPAVMQDLERVCSMCPDHSRCEHDMARDSSDPAWKSYCPNVMTLEALKAQA
ncbi:MAG: hypothetical protein AB7O50_05065 [Pseudolabrys sp.]